MVSVDKFLLLKLHPCADGLSDEVVHDIGNQCDLLRCESGEILHKANDPMAFVYLVIHGRVKLSLIDIQGNVLLERYQMAGTQVGALAAASGEPSPMQVEIVEPSTLLRLNYQTLFELTKQHDIFRQNLSRIIAEAVNSTLMGERRKKLPQLISIFHQSPATRELARRLVIRLHDLDRMRTPFMTSRIGLQSTEFLTIACYKTAVTLPIRKSVKKSTRCLIENRLSSTLMRQSPLRGYRTSSR
jgi:CRP-like cAMP-binding protein